MGIVVEPQIARFIVEQSGSTTVEIGATTIVEAVQQGPAGPPGNATIIGVAGQNLSGHRAVAPGLDGRYVYASHLDASAHAVVGITLNAALENDTVRIAISGEVVEPSWNWTPQGTVYLLANGTLSQTAPTNGIVKQIGVALSATKLLLQVQLSIVLL